MDIKQKILIKNWSSKFVHFVYIPIWIASYFIPLFISSLTVPTYTMATEYISNYGSPYGNPDGWVIWSVAHLLNGALMIPMVYYISLHRGAIFDTTHPRFERLFKFGRLMMYTSAVGWIFMFVFPQYHGLFWNFMHGLNAVMLLGGEYLGLIFWGFLHLKAKQVKRSGKALAILFGWFAPAGFLLFQSMRLILGIPFDTPERDLLWIFTIPTWEWALMIGGFAAVIEMICMISDQK